jgi:hypothetical protein
MKEHLIGEMFGKQKRTPLAARWAEVEAFAAERSEIVMPAIWVRTPDSGHTLQIVPATAESPAYVLDSFGAEAAVLLCIPILVLVAELVEVTREDLMKLIPSARNVPRARWLSSCGQDCHDIQYGGIVVVDSLPA